MRKIWSAAEEARLKQIYEVSTKEEIMQEFGTSWNKIKDKATKLGGLNRQTCKVNESEVIADYVSGIALKDIWNKHDISNPTLANILKKHNILKRNTSIKDIDCIQFADDYDRLTMEELKKKYNASGPTLLSLARKLKLKRSKIFLYNRPKLLNEEAEICNKYKLENKSMQMLSDEYNVPPTTILNTLHKHKISIKRGIYGAAEQEIRAWIESSTGLSFPSNRDILARKEIDMYNEELKVGIEYCGLIWHCDYFNKIDRNYHYDKYLKCKEKGIHLITIFEDEWLNKKEQVKGVLLSILKLNKTKIHARKCTIKMLDRIIGNKFYDDYHIQGKSSISTHYAGLYFKDELIGVMSFGRHHRDTNKTVLDRLCFKPGISVAGGSSRLFKFLVDNTNVTSLISWSDNRWFIGEVYKNLGFVKEIELKPDYSYVDVKKINVRVSKQSQKKDNTGCPSGMTEKEWSEKRGLYRIWDCGKIRWIWNKQ
jgi:hypothetical protein